MLLRENLLAYTIEEPDTILKALTKIDINKKGFLVVVTPNMKVVGTLTDGDIRRAFINGANLDDLVEQIYNRSFRFLYLEEDISAATEMFKNGEINFLPVVDKNMKLCNIITKSQIHSLLLQDIHANLEYNFMSLDEGIIDYEVFHRPWGFYKTTVMNDYFQSKVISINPGEQLSLQSHNHREEYWIVAHGVGMVQLDQSIKEVHCGSTIFIPKGCKHRLTNIDKKESLIVTEVQIGDYFGEDDITRYEDIYGRV